MEKNSPILSFESLTFTLRIRIYRHAMRETDKMDEDQYLSLFFSASKFFSNRISYHAISRNTSIPFLNLESWDLGSRIADYDRGQYHICPCRFRGYTCINTKETRKVIRFESIRNRFGFFCSIIVLKGRQRPDRRPRDRPQLVSTGSPMTHTRKIPDTEPISRLSFTRPR